MLTRILFTFIISMFTLGVAYSQNFCDETGYSLTHIINSDGTVDFYVESLSDKQVQVCLSDFDIPDLGISINYNSTVSGCTQFAISTSATSFTNPVVVGSSLPCQIFDATLTFFSISCPSTPLITLTTTVVIDNSVVGGIISTSLGCGSYSFVMSPTLNITYPVWGFGDGQTSTDISPVHDYASNGSYVVTVQEADGSGCPSFINLNVLDVANSSFSWTADCSNTIVDFTAQGLNDEYIWDFGDGTTLTGVSASVSHTYLSDGEYTVILTVNNLIGSSTCSSSSSQIVLAGQLQPDFDFQNLCNGQPFSPSNLPLWASSYDWNFGDGTTESGYLINHLFTPVFSGGSAVYTVTLTTTTGTCPGVSVSHPVTIFEPIIAGFTSVVDNCLLEQYVFTPDATQMASYDWTFTNESTTNSLPGASLTHVFTQSGLQDVTLTVSNGECINSATQQITVSPLSVVINNSTPVLCGNSSADLQAIVDGTGTYTYEWTDQLGNVVGLSDILTVSTQGTYTVIITDPLCLTTATASQLVTILTTPDVTSSIQIQGTSCPGSADGILELTIPSFMQAGTGYTINGQGPFITSTYALINLSEGTTLFTIAYADNPECNFIGNSEITYQGPELVVTSQPTGCGASTGVLSLSATGPGSTTLSNINWTLSGSTFSLSSNPVFNSVSAGFYQVEAMVDGCVLTDVAQVVSSTITIDEQSTYSCGSTLAQISLSPSSSIGSESYSYLWSDGQTGSTVSLGPGNYSVTITGATSGCIISHNVEVFSIGTPTITFTTTPVNCVDLTGDISAQVTGGSGNYSYAWNSSGPNSPNLNNTVTGNYILDIEDLTTGCLASASVTLDSPPSFLLDIPPVSITNCEATAFISPTDPGTAPYVFTWTQLFEPDGVTPGTYVYSTNQETTNSLEPGSSYELTVVDDLGCSITVADAGSVSENIVAPVTFNFVFQNIDYQEPEPPKEQQYDDILAEEMAEAADFISEQLSECIATQNQNTVTAAQSNCGSLNFFKDNMTLSYDIHHQQYTLYYYDRAGNLTKTVPPEGTEFLTEQNIEKIKTFRRTGNLADGPDISLLGGEYWIPNHRLITTYNYNALNQLKSQNTPDGGTARFIYDGLQRLRFSQNARQLANNKFSYMKYDALGRVIEAGESNFVSAELDFSNSFSSVSQTTAAISDYPQTSNTQVIRSHYSELSSVDYYGNAQTYLQNRISFIQRDEDGNPATLEDNYVTYYSYDVHGNVKWIIQQDPIIGKNYMEYDYDLISGNVLKVSYNKNRVDKYFHRYNYDADNRLLSTETSRDGFIWDKDGEYDYYDHGPLRLLKIGQDNIQQIDYTYTIQGWLKAINDPNQVLETTNANTNLQAGVVNTSTSDAYLSDAFGMSLGYYQGDFVRTDVGNPYTSLSQGNFYGSNDLYNGNISSWNWKTATGDARSKSMTMVYRYDNLQRIKQMNSYTFDQTALALNQNIDNRFNTSYSFDRNGNLHTLTRNDDQGNQMDDLNYTYFTQTGIAETGYGASQKRTTNKLHSVQDALAGTGIYTDLIGIHSYIYDESGNLIQDNGQEEFGGETGPSDIWDVNLDIDWTVDNKVKTIIKTLTKGGVTKTEMVRFHYDPMGVRIGKTYVADASNASSSELTANYTRYVLDAQGNTMGIYKIDVQVADPTMSSLSHQATLRLIERPIYGASRLGMDATIENLQTWYFDLGSAPTFAFDDNGIQTISELTNWITPLLKTTTLGNSKLCECEIRHTSFDNSLATLDFIDHGPAVSYYGKTQNGVTVGETIDGTLDVYATVAQHYLGDQTTALVYNIDNELIMGVETMATPFAESKPIIARDLQSVGNYQLFTLDDNQHPMMHQLNMNAQGWGQTPVDIKGEITEANVVLDNSYIYGAHMALLEDQLNDRNLLYMTRYIPSILPDACLGEIELVVFEITSSSISNPVVMARFESGDQNGLGELQLSQDATQLVYYNRKETIAGFAHRMVELNVFGLTADHTTIITQTPIIRPDDYAGIYGKASVDFTPLANLHYSQQGIYEQNASSEKQVIYFNTQTQVYEYTVPLAAASSSYLEVRRGKNQIMYVPAQKEADLYYNWLENTANSEQQLTITSTTGFELLSSLPSQPHTTVVSNPQNGAQRLLGNKYYELSDHLGNVRYVISDQRMFVDITPSLTDPLNEYTLATTDNQIAWSDYYPYGSYLAKRHVQNNSYRYGFNGMEGDDEVKGNGNSYTTEFRQYDPRVARWLSLDPLMNQFPWMSPYVAFDNNPVYFTDPYGLESQDNIHIYSNGTISKEETDDATNTYTYHNSDGTEVDLGTYAVTKNITISYSGQTVTKDMVNLKGVKTDFLKAKYIQSGNIYLDENLTGALLGAAYETKQSTGKRTYINQLNALKGGHSKHGSLGDRTDLQYMGKDHKEGVLHTTSSNFDKKSSAILIDNMKKFGYTTFYTQDAAGSSTPAIDGTRALNPHHHHLHGDANDQGGTISTSTYKPAIKVQSSESVERQTQTQQNKTTGDTQTETKQKTSKMGFFEELWEKTKRAIYDIQTW